MPCPRLLNSTVDLLAANSWLFDFDLILIDFGWFWLIFYWFWLIWFDLVWFWFYFGQQMFQKEFSGLHPLEFLPKQWPYIDFEVHPHSCSKDSTTDLWNAFYILDLQFLVVIVEQNSLFGREGGEKNLIVRGQPTTTSRVHPLFWKPSFDPRCVSRRWISWTLPCFCDAFRGREGVSTSLREWGGGLSLILRKIQGIIEVHQYKSREYTRFVSHRPHSSSLFEQVEKQWTCRQLWIHRLQLY